jgi:hypothetical protein
MPAISNNYRHFPKTAAKNNAGTLQNTGNNEN